MSADPEVIVIGAGPNGLVAACTLARAGLKVLVLEAHPTRPGGALAHEEATLPGFVHDVGAAFFPFSQISPAFRSLDLAQFGLRWTFSPIDSAHPAPDGSLAVLARDHEWISKCFGSPEDAAKMRAIARWHREVEPNLLPAMLETFPAIGPGLRLLPFAIFRVLSIFLRSGAALSQAWFRSEAARRVIPGLALHTDVGPDDTFGSGIGYMLAMMSTSGGNAIPQGGSGAITAALVKMLEHHGGEIRVNSRITKIEVVDGRAGGVVLADGTAIRASKAVVSDTSAASLLLDLVDGKHLPGRIVRKMRSFRQGWGTFKVDWALNGPVPWAIPELHQAAVVHAGDSIEDLRRFTNEVRGGSLPSNPYLVIGQQSLSDPSRAPAGKHTLWAYSRVPNRAPSGDWASEQERFADRIDDRIEGLAPGFKAAVLGRRVVSPAALEAMDANLVGGDLGGGSNAWHRLLIFRPVFPWFRYRMPVKGLYLCSSYTHPGAGVHGMCGFNAAGIVLRDLG